MTVSAETSKTTTYQYNGVGLVSSMQVTGEDVFSYDYNGRNQLSSATNPNSVTVSFTYHDGGRRTRMTRPGSYIDYSYNARDWITAVVNRGTGGVSTYQYDDLGRPTTMTYGNSSRAETQYDDAGRIQAVRNRKSDGTVISIFTYSYDPANNPTGAEEGNGDLVSWSYGEINQLSRSSLFSSLIFVVTHRRPSSLPFAVLSRSM